MCSVSMSRRLPSSTFMPYTTLFRSRQDKSDRAVNRALGLYHESRKEYPEATRYWEAVARAAPGDSEAAAKLRNLAALQDRKSTRLNSSHLGISYAVFCLKKKTEKES